MREPNLSFPSQNRAAVCITSALYDRRALDCTATLPMINSLTHLVYLTSTSPRIREILAVDGGLEQLVHMLSVQHIPNDLHSLWKWSLSFQCVVNVGVRGTEQIRTKVVDAGMIVVVLRVLQSFLRALELVSQENEQYKKRQEEAAAAARSSFLAGQGESIPAAILQEAGQLLLSTGESNSNNNGHFHQPSPFTLEDVNELSAAATAEATNGNSREPTPEEEEGEAAAATATTTAELCRAPTPRMHSSPNNNTLFPLSSLPIRHINPSSVIRRTTFPYIKMSRKQRRRNRFQQHDTAAFPGAAATFAAPSAGAVDTVFYREEDILMSLQLLAYLSKYPHIRHQFHTAYSVNVFSVVEKFTYRMHPNFQYWAGVIMRNACRKDETQGGIRRCANMHCGKWEQKPREFAKCRRCRKAKYCSKACQSRAWSDGHRWWCVERQSTAATAAAAAAAAAAGTPSGPLSVPTTGEAPTTNMPTFPSTTHATAMSADQGQPQHEHH
ncbi:hypothetical protein BX666DRAFT_1117214 [Dichotomocladium elegans]|nr:hypothetical protein BX666DRAFT_1117214 [Dichotomocladium elegans]